MKTYDVVKESILEKQDRFPKWMQQHIPTMQFKLVTDLEMLRLGGKNEQIACSSDVCYFTKTFTTYSKEMQRVYFYIDYLSMFDYGRGRVCELLENLMHIPEYTLKTEIDKGLQLCNDQSKWFIPITPKVKQELLSIDFVDEDIRKVLKTTRRPTIYNNLPKCTYQKARLIATSLITQPLSILGTKQVVLDTSDMCVVRVGYKFTTGGEPLELRDYPLEVVLYYHYKTKRFVGINTKAYTTFKQRNKVLIELMDENI